MKTIITAATKKQPSKAAVKTALINSYKMHGKYTCTPTETGDLFIVQNIEDNTRTYGVTTIPGIERCGCEYFNKEGVCKHMAFVDQILEIEAEEAKLSDPDYIGYIAR